MIISVCEKGHLSARISRQRSVINEEAGMSVESDSESVKRLLILLLLKLGSTSQEIGDALGVDASVIRKMMSIKGIKKIESIR
ncbi:MAG: hypothetical protein ACYDCD_08085 [Candidatus Acidiferrales bacterium]